MSDHNGEGASFSQRDGPLPYHNPQLVEAQSRIDLHVVLRESHHRSKSRHKRKKNRRLIL